MDFRTIATLASVLSIPFGLGFVLAPSASAALYGVPPPDAATSLIGRYFGSEVLMYAAALWALRDRRDAEAQRRAAGVIAVATVFGLGVSLLGVVGGTMNALGWSSVALYGFFVVAWARLALQVPAPVGRTGPTGRTGRA
jgi:hypothetical protein